MLDWLFNGTEMVNAWKSLFLTIGILALIGFILWIMFQTGLFNPFMKIFGKVIVVVVVIALVISGVYSYAYISAYHKDEGGIYGKLTKVVYNSIEEVKGENESITYNFENLVFREDDDGKYSIIFIQDYKDEDHRTRFQNGEKYSIFVHNNGSDYECNYIQYEIDWIVAEYSYVFYNSHDETDVIGDDTLSFDFCFYENYSYLKITSSADYTIIQLWDAYFQKYNFQVSIKVVDEVYEPIEFQNNVIDGYVQITYVIDESLTPRKELYLVEDSIINLKTKYVEDEFYILGWVDEYGKEVTSISKKNSANITIYAQTKKTTALYKVNFYNQPGTEIINTKYYEFDDKELNYMVDPSEVYDGMFEGFFVYWTTEQCEFVGIGEDYSNYPKIETIDDLILNYPAGTQEFNLYPILYSYY